MADEKYLAIPNVRAISDGLPLVCEIDGIRYGIARWAIRADSSVQAPGDHGLLVIEEGFAQTSG